MAYIGQPPFQEFTSAPSKDSFTGDGSTTAFDLAGEVAHGGENALEVFINNVRQEPGSGKAYTLGNDGSDANKRITFTAAPANGAAIYVINDKTNLTAIAPAATDLNGVELILDADADTSITADTDDRIDFKIANTDHISFGTSSGDTVIKAMVDAKDILFQQYDGRTLLDINDGGYVALANGATGPGQLRLYEDTDLGTNYTAFQVGTQSADITYTLPTADGTSGYQLATDGSGTLSWAAAGTTFANDGNNRVVTGTGSATLNGEANLTFDGSTLAVTGAATVSTTLGVTGALTGSSTVQGTTITATTAFVPDASDGAALGTTSLEFSDLYLADGAVIGFGDDQDVTLTHVADTGLLLSSTDQLQFGDSGTYIFQSADGVLDLVSDTEIELNATTLDINANVEISGTATTTGVHTFTAVPVLPANTIDSAHYVDGSIDTAHYASGSVDGTALAANAVGLAELAGIARGKIIYGNASGDPAVLSVGTNGQALVSDGTDISWGSAGASTLDGLSDVLYGGSDFANSLIIGHQTTGTLSSAEYNTAVGHQSLDAITTGDSNSALGSGTLGANTTGTNNTAVGRNALILSTTGSDNTALGKDTLANNTTASNNTAVGKNSLGGNTTGHSNTAVGFQSLDANTTANDNVAVGRGAATANTTGASNVAVGNYALDANTTSNYQVAVGYNALGASVTHTVNADSYNVAVGHEAGKTLTTGVRTTAIGGLAMQTGAITGDDNTAVGAYAMRAMSTGSDNTAVGAYAGVDQNTGSKNVSVGYSSNYKLTTQSNSTAIGYSALSNTVAHENTAVGSQALQEDTSGTRNVAVGYRAGYVTTTGGSNTAIGYQALDSNTTGTNNTAVGYNCAHGMTTGSENHCFGITSGAGITTGTSNIAIGYDVLTGATTGNKNIYIGQSNGDSGVTGDNNITIGYHAGRSNSPSGNITSGSNQLCLGNSSISDIFCADTSISSSDSRDKTDIENFTTGLSFVNQMRPVTYRWDKRVWYVDDNATPSDILAAVPDGTHKKTKQNVGFLAQEIETLEKEIGFATSKDNQLFCNTNNDDTAMGLKYERLVPILVNAIQELSAEVTALKNA